MMILNVHFAPFSFGGATIVAEELATRMKLYHGWEVLVVTTIIDPSLPAYAVRRFKAKGIDVVAINIFGVQSYKLNYKNDQIESLLIDLCSLFDPAVCHFHAVQHIGAGLLSFLTTIKCKSMVTLHDCWWLCERQFMINSDGYYCDQKKIDSRICQYCVDDVDESIRRTDYLRNQLSKADLLLFPSEFQRQLYIDNGFKEDICVVNKNGVNLPGREFSDLRDQKRQSRERMGFGFLGGPGRLKGSDLIVSAFNTLDSKNYELKIVDAAANIGSTWGGAGYWNVPGKVKYIDAYSQDTIDDFFSEIDVLLFPSQWKESFGLVVREALARDVWVIATGAGGVAEDIVDGVNGRLLPLTEDIKPLTTAIDDRLSTQDWREYRNQFSSDVRSFDEQASELNDLVIVE
jgi:glycosyltransferase involved in cell wall biosynthesis